MERKARLALFSLTLFALSSLVALPRAQVLTNTPLNFALVNGRWFNGKAFSARTVYSVGGTFTFRKPARVDRTLDLAGSWVVPPFGEAHNHNVGTGVEALDRKAIRRYLVDGVFYVKSQGNLPLTDAMKTRLRLNRPDSIDIVLAQGSLTATGAHPAFLVEEILLRQGVFPGYTKETLRDMRYFAIRRCRAYSRTCLEPSSLRYGASFHFVRRHLACLSDPYDQPSHASARLVSVSKRHPRFGSGLCMRPAFSGARSRARLTIIVMCDGRRTTSQIREQCQ